MRILKGEESQAVTSRLARALMSGGGEGVYVGCTAEYRKNSLNAASSMDVPSLRACNEKYM